MTDQQHPITPPPELVHQWRKAPEYITELKKLSMINITTDRLQEIATWAARWGADQELEACCEWLCVVDRWKTVADRMRDARRPESPSLKEQALAVIENSTICDHLTPEHEAILRRALEQLND